MKQIQFLQSKENILLNKIMSSIAISLIVAGISQATTLDQLAKKNGELLGLKADLEIAKTKSELQKLRPGSNMGIGASETLIQPKAIKVNKPVKASLSAAIDDVEFIGAGGDSINPVGKFIVGNATILRKQGEIINGWSLVRITANEVTLTKLEKGETHQKSIYLSSVNRLTERRQQNIGSTSSNPTQIVPAVAPQQPPIR